MEQRPPDQLLPVDPVQLPPGIFQHIVRHMYISILKRPQSPEYIFSFPAIAHHRIPRLFIDSGRGHTGQRLQKVEKCIRLFAGHPSLLHMQADAPSYLVSDPVFQL